MCYQEQENMDIQAAIRISSMAHDIYKFPASFAFTPSKLVR